MGRRQYHADDICVGQAYLMLYQRYKDPAMLRPVKQRADSVIAFPAETKIHIKAKNGSKRWSWCDALFMAPPVYALLANITGDNSYREFMNCEFYASSRSLFDAAENLYYRDARYFDKREKNGKKVFWGRGNGWCYAALAILLETLPESDPMYDYYRRMFLRMSEAVVACQDARGSWHPSMLDHETYPMPENSASGFFTYGLAWGVNHGLLTAPVYKRAARRGWKALWFICRPGRTPRICAAHRRIAPADEPRNDRGVRSRRLPDGRLGNRTNVAAGRAREQCDARTKNEYTHEKRFAAIGITLI